MDKLKATGAFLAYTALIFTVVLVPHAIAYALVPDVAPHKTSTELIRVCPTEDSVNCFWNASEQGNGLGNDLWN